MTSQPGCDCSICDEAETEQGSDDDTNRLQVSTSVDPIYEGMYE